MAPMNKTDIPINSERENVSEIQSLTVRANELQGAFDFWNTGYVWLVGFTVFLALVVFFTQFMSIKKGKELVKAQSELLQAKDEQLARDLQGKDMKIAETQTVAAMAHKKAEELKRENLVLESKVEKERNSRIELEQAVSPRIMEQHKSSEALKVLTGVTAIITNIPDLESQKMAGQLAATLNMAGWKIQFAPYNPQDIYPDGVVVETNAGATPKEDVSSKAAELLLTQLETNKIESRTMPTTGLPPNTMFIKVGFKPYTFFSDKMNPDENIRVHGNMIMPPR
jgi:hypothetical protein